MRTVWYPKNKAKHMAMVKVSKTKRKRELQAIIDDIKHRRGCQRCPENDPACLDFHHRDPDSKLDNIGTAIADTWTLEALQLEIDKCDVLCSNCHRKLHKVLREGELVDTDVS